MEEIYIAVIIAVCAIATFAVNRKYMALPYIICVTLLPAHINIIRGSVNIWGLDLLSVSILPLIVIRGGFKYPFRFSPLDLMLPIMCLWIGIAWIVAGEDLGTAFQRFIRLLSPWYFPYLVGRLGCKSWEGLKVTLFVLAVVGCILAGFTAFEAVTGRNILSFLGIGINPTIVKWGFWRSRATMSSFHILGMALAILAIYSCACFFSRPKDHKTFLILTCILLGGVIVSTSATGVMLALMGLTFLGMYTIREHVPKLLSIFFVLNVIAHFASKDGIHFVYARRLGFLGEAWYRAKLIDVTLAAMPGHYLFGMGYTKVKVGTVDDMCNMWLLMMVLGGLPSFFALVVFYFGMLFRLKKCYVLLNNFRGERVILWGFLSALVGLAGAWFYIALYGSDIALYSFFFGLTVSLPDLAMRSLRGEASSP